MDAAITEAAPVTSAAEPELWADTRRLVRLWGVAVLGSLLLAQVYQVRGGLDFRDLDDLTRTLTARWWASFPFFMTDGYWLPLPAAARGLWVRLLPAEILRDPALMLPAMRLITIAYLWGCWRLLAAVAIRLGGGGAAVGFLSAAFVLNGGTFHLSASNYSEPDAFFWSLAALVVVMGCLDAGDYPPRRLLAAGAALACACLVRYEAWTLPPVLAGAILLHARPLKRPGRRWAWLLILLVPSVPVVAWIIASALKQGSPFHFLRHAGEYVGTLRPEHPAAAIAESFLRISAVWLPAALVLGLVELRRQKRRSAADCFGAVTALMLGWAFHRQWAFPVTIRFAWDAAMLIAVPAAVAAERIWAAHPARTSRLLFALVGALAVTDYSWMMQGLLRYIPAGLRQIAREVRSETEGPILLRDHLRWDQEAALQTFRLYLGEGRLVLTEWVEREEKLDLAELERAGVLYVLALNEPKALAVGPPLIANEQTGWTLWPYQPGAGAPGPKDDAATAGKQAKAKGEEG